MPARPSWSRSSRTRPASARRRLSVEHLEDRSVPAYFDPTFGAGGAFQAGSTAADGAFRMTRDTTGNLYVAGSFAYTTDFDPGPGVSALTSQGFYDGFVAKYSPAGDLLWARNFGSTQSDHAFAIEVDSGGNVYVGARADSTGADFDLGTSYPDNRDIAGGGCIAKYNADGSFGWVWHAAAPGIGWSDVADVAVDAAGNVYGIGSYPNPSASWVAGSVVKIDLQGAQQWRDDIAGSKGGFVGRGLTLDGAGNLYLVAGIRGKIDVDPGAGTTTLSSNAMSTVVEKLSPAGGFVWAKQLQGSDRVEGYDVAVDGAGNVYTAGFYAGKADFNPDGKGTYTLTAPAAGGTFVSKLDAAGNFAWAKGMGAGDNSSYQLALDPAGGVYVSGSFQGSGDFNPGSGTTTLTSAGGTDGFVMKLDAGGNFGWALRMGGTDFDYVKGLAVDPAGDVYVAGFFNLTADFGSTTLTSAGSGDMFLAKIKQ